jgi:hypothetical protein
MPMLEHGPGGLLPFELLTPGCLAAFAKVVLIAFFFWAVASWF